MKDEIKVLLVDDHAVMRKGLVMLLSEEADISVVGEAGDGVQAIEQVRTLQPDVVVMDISMPNLNGIEATEKIAAEFPRSKVIALSIHSSRRFVDDMLKAGAAGFLLKESVPEELIQGIRAVMQGKMFMSAAITSTVLSAYMQKIPAGSADEASAKDFFILKSKLYPPTITPDIIPRQKLTQQLEAGKARPLTLVSAPPGYGKSTLIGSWLNQSSWPSAWLSLDQDDSDLRQFLNYFVAAVKSLFPQVFADSHALTLVTELPSLSMVARTLSNDLEAIEQPFFLVLDDYYRIDVGSAVNDLLQHLLSHPPIPLHLAILSRRDPPLPLAKLRAQGQMTEIRMQDLQFSKTESRTLLENSTGIAVSEQALNNLELELEGWPAGIRLVSLAMQQHEDPDEFLQHLHGGLQQTQEYLIQEVINNQSQQLRASLLKSSILERFCAPLCDALCIESDNEVADIEGKEFIQALWDRNLFVIPLDSRGEWFRYHHLFGLLLRNELMQRLSASEIAQIHLRASHWYEQHQLIVEAIQHALLGGDEVTAADIIERNYQTALNLDRWYFIELWLEKISVEMIKSRPALLFAQAYVAFFRQQLVKLTTILNEVETCLVDQPEDSELRVTQLFFRGYLHFWEGNTEASLRELETVAKQAPAEQQMLIAETELHLGLVRVMRGDKALAIKALDHQIAQTGLSTGPLLSRLIAGLAMVHLLSGSLQPLRFEARRMRELATPNRTLLVDSWSYYLEAAGDLQVMELELALQHFSAASEHDYATDIREAVDAMACLALTQQLMQRPVDANITLKRLTDFACGSNDPVLINVARSCEVRICLLQGDLKQAVQWAEQLNESPQIFDLFLWLEVPAISQVRVLIADGSPQHLQKAGVLLEDIRALSEANGFNCQLIEIMVLQSLTLYKQGQLEPALALLGEVLIMAETGGWLRPFVEPGQPMIELLEHFARHQGRSDFLDQVLVTCSTQPLPATNAVLEKSQFNQDSLSWGGEKLTKRELEILELLVERLQNKEIANRLFVSTETVKTHLKHLYQKLGVSTRREASMKSAEVLAAMGVAVPTTPSAHNGSKH